MGLMIRTLVVLGISVVVSACSTSRPLPSCCYEGDVSAVYMEQIDFVVRPVSSQTYQEVFPGLVPDQSLFTLALAFDEADVDLVIYPSLIDLLPRYDANENRLLEEPELIVLYLVEGARGLGSDVSDLRVDGRAVRAINLPQAERGGLTRYLRDRRSDMSPAGQKIFLELDELGRDLLIFTEGPDNRRDGRIMQP